MLGGIGAGVVVVNPAELVRSPLEGVGRAGMQAASGVPTLHTEILHTWTVLQDGPISRVIIFSLSAPKGEWMPAPTIPRYAPSQLTPTPDLWS